MNFSEILEQIKVNFPRPMGIAVLGDEFGEPGPHFLIILKVFEEDFINIRNSHNIEPLLTFIPTEYYPNLWFRLRIDYGSKGSGGTTASFFCEYNFSILSEKHMEILDDLNRADEFTLLFINSDCTQTSSWNFSITDKVKTNIKIEIQACKAA